IDTATLLSVADHKTVVGHGIDDARDAVRVRSDPRDGPVREEIEISGPRDAQPEADVGTHLVRRERTNPAPERDPLLELVKLGQGQLRSKLGLAREEDLEQRLAGGLKVRQEPDLLEGLRRQVLSLVDDDERLLTGPVALDQEAVEGDQALGAGQARR